MRAKSCQIERTAFMPPLPKHGAMRPSRCPLQRSAASSSESDRANCNRWPLPTHGAMRPSRCPLQQSAASSSESGSILERAEQPRADPDRVTPPKREDRAPSRMPPNPVNPKKRPRADPDKEYFFDLKLEKMPVLEAVGTFAQCLADFAVSFAVGCWLVSESVHLLTVSSD